jgi:hypothetical protein
MYTKRDKVVHMYEQRTQSQSPSARLGQVFGHDYIINLKIERVKVTVFRLIEMKPPRIERIERIEHSVRPKRLSSS